MQQPQSSALLTPINFNLAAHQHMVIGGKIMEWTNDDALELIEQYRIHTELWNRADPKYKDKLCRFRAWSEIAERFGCSKAEVERKMNVLLTQYRREKHKMLVKLYQGIQPNPSKWYAFKRFDFMEAGGGGGGSSSRSGTNGHTTVGTVAAAAAVTLNGLNTYDATTTAAQQTTSAAMAAAAVAAAPSTSHHRRMKKEMKYFGAMGISLPMLIANTTTLDTWNTVGQYSPPIGSDRNQLRVPLPMPFPSSQSELNVASSATRSLFGGSSNSDMTASPQKPMETSDIEEKEEMLAKRERVTPSSVHNVSGGSEGGPVGSCAVGAIAASSGSNASSSGVVGSRSGVGGAVVEAIEEGSSPIPNTNTMETHEKRRRTTRDQDELDIKRELVDYFHAPHPPAPPDSHRSYSSTDENRLGGIDPDDFAQDLRVSAAAAAAAKGLDFSQFVLPPNLRRSSESIEEKFVPLNMRKLNSASTTATTAGQMLMNSLLSNESLSEETATSASGRIKSGSQETASTSAAAAAAALYAESLNKDDCDFIGSNVTLKLRSMDRTQRIIAEKLISEVLFYGQFNELERSAHIQPK
ncbi:pneumococcal serine-rich repeat protein [Anastrepha obliqua]|uniref:pneumococcal serine-rich repeat protein n=1 Tax=Anastrepha obliqua TaxID=95512 RepID=UPI0024090E34|nr:pneumococcal serine-rich repeat protein [Anastrepha obliqua]XP_054741681.1 pneumococcal serine-rich repeat protein [Anastrepha obliqua]XP_054741682.1 pneumococcal serine-rich repeat protein [Anastrepha obliqua]XP_054741683.1 pneumococcal serine-rich repeat protein [Anastrepha obliqua]XP_054741684.1 pneumococcal serine-rich repeat protein [Anastrepha obliqua]XP_054741685.1 pneumococcal serine-rich repeat protein [Anastrepha obliqua]XP_054741686.1 pneumococcal serine-rich repeat protein [Ana